MMRLSDRLAEQDRQIATLARRVDVLTATHPRRLPSINDVITAVSAVFGISRAELLGTCRARALVQPRQCVMALAFRHARRSYCEIGRRLGRDHSTVIHGVTVHALREAADDDYAALVRRVELLITPQETSA